MTASVEVLDTDITTLEVDAIANAANTRLLHGGGVAGAIARAGGPEIQDESDRRAPVGLGARLQASTLQPRQDERIDRRRGPRSIFDMWNRWRTQPATPAL